jgi:PKD repeat protein
VNGYERGWKNVARTSTKQKRFFLNGLMRPATVAFAWLVVMQAVAAENAKGLWVENEDAGDLPATAQTTTASCVTRLSEIRGTYAQKSADVYRLTIVDGAAFSATTVGGAAWDTMLTLFDADGKGVLQNDDASSEVKQSTLPAGQNLAPGTYFLAVSHCSVNPQGFSSPPFPVTAVNLFPVSPESERTALRTPTTDGAQVVLERWSGTENGGDYVVYLTGAGYAAGETQDRPVFLSAVAAGPSPAAVGQNVSFQVAAFAAEHDPFVVSWDFGDGATAVGETATHAFAAAGTYAITVFAQNRSSVASLSKTVVVGAPFLLADLKSKFSFGKRADQLKLLAYLELADDFSTHNAELLVDLGGFTETFMLNARGKAKSARGTVRLSLDKKFPGRWRLQASLKDKDLASHWKDEGVVEGQFADEPVVLQNVVTLDGKTVFVEATDCRFNAKTVGKGTNGTLVVP